MVTEMSTAETRQMSHMDRKRPAMKQYAAAAAAPSMVSATTQTTAEEGEAKRPCCPPTNNGWGELYKDRQTFVEMHLC